MAEQNTQPNSIIAHSFSGGMVQDMLDDFVKSDFYRYARNATNILPDGGGGGISTECSNIKCTDIPYVLIGAIPMNGSEWMLFFTDDVNSEIGIFNEDTCTYTTLTGNQPCLGFNRRNLISGASRRGFDCGYDVYWSDGARNPDRFINTAKVPFVCVPTLVSPGCFECIPTTVLDCEKLRIAPVFNVPCLTLAKSQNSGTLLNGSYQVCMAYTINSIRCTDYIALSNVQSIWAHSGQAGAVVLNLTNTETDNFDEMEVVIISMVNSQVQAKRLGLYSTRQTTIYIDNLDTELLTVPLELIPVSTPAIEKSDSISSISNYLLRIGTYTQPDFNYQPLANQIRAWWVAVDYPEDYYHKGGLNGFPMNVGFMRKERYAAFIRWVYTTGEKSASYHIPGLPAGFPGTFSLGGPSVGDGSTTVASGRMVGYSSTEIYPDNQPLVWGTLCGQPIRHHEFPDAATTFGTGSVPGGAFPVLSHYSPSFPTSATSTSNSIRIMGWYFDNIAPPVDNNGVVIPNIQGYEILRATRNGHEHVLAKGMINNMRSYTVPGSGDEGLYQNYPYNDLNPDLFLTSNVALINTGSAGVNLSDPLIGVKDDVFSFHSPDTVFEHPQLGSGDLRVSMILSGNAVGHFVTPWEHPKFQVLTNFDSIIANFVSALSTALTILNAVAGNPPNVVLASTENLPMDMPLYGSTDMPDGLIAGTSTVGTIFYAIQKAFNIAIAVILAPIQFRVIQQQLLNVIKGLIPARQFATQYNSYGRYNIPLSLQGGAMTVGIQDYLYIRGYNQYFAGAAVNNLYRNNYLGIQLTGNIPRLAGEFSRFLLSQVGGNKDWQSGGRLFSYYAAYTVPQGAQYGQVDSAKQVPVSCMIPVIPTAGARFTSPVIFGGDTYINRYTEKNPFFYFNDWLKQAPNDIEYDYRNYVNVPYPRFWIDNTNVYYDFLALAENNRRLDLRVSSLFYVASGNFYTFNNGCRDFFVESTVNVGYRDWEDLPSKQFYDPYGSSREFIDIMFRSDIINSDILYKYDYSLSANRFINQYLSWGQCLRRDYDPVLAYTCFSYYPRRVHYSLPQEEELRKDNWRMFLPNNYKDFNSRVVAIKNVGKSGALILQDDDSPYMLLGVESIPSSSGTEYSTGTGSLFNQQLTSITNVDQSYQYASCQSRLGVLNTPYGLFWVSQKTGKVFHYGGQLDDITRYGMKMWFSLYLPSQLLRQIPNYDLVDNPVVGIGCQMVYDSTNELVYITKKDYKVRTGKTVLYDPVTGFSACPCPTGFTCSNYSSFTDMWTCIGASGGVIRLPGLPPGSVQLGDPTYFEDASWTISYDPKKKEWVSFHDWHPSLTMGTKTHFITTIPTTGTNTLWRHNQRTTSFCNYYGIDYPFAVETPITGQGADATVESIEYLMEAYNYKANQYDKFNQYDNGMNRMMVVNPEQSTVWMDMQLQPWNDPFATLAFPSITSAGTQNTLYSKVENKYRIGDIRDYTNDRGATIQTGSLNQTQAIITAANGYTFNINGLYTDPNKPTQQKKKLRHYNNRIYLQRSLVGLNSMTLRYLQVNGTRSFR